MALAGAVGAEHGDALAEVDLQIERVGQPVELELLDDERSLAGARPAETHRDALIAHIGRPLLALDELPEAALGGLQPGGEDVPVARPPAHLGNDGLESFALVVVQRSVLVELVEMRPAGVGIAGEPTAERPRAERLDRHDLRRRRRQQLTVVADVQHGLARCLELAFQPTLGVDVEEVVGLVEEQHVGVAAQQHFEGEALLLTARQRVQRSPGDFVEGEPDRPRRALVPVHLGGVAAGVAPGCHGMGVAHRIRRGRRLRRVMLGVGALQRRRGQRHEQLADGLRSVA